MALTKVLITVKTYPNLSTKYEELVCTAGFREDGTWIRIYPVQFRQHYGAMKATLRKSVQPIYFRYIKFTLHGTSKKKKTTHHVGPTMTLEFLFLTFQKTKRWPKN